MSEALPNAGTFTIYLEDHTIGNLLRLQVLQNQETKFAGYKKPHPCENKVEIKVQTYQQTKPIDAMNKSINQLLHKINNFAGAFERELIEFKKNKY